MSPIEWIPTSDTGRLPPFGERVLIGFTTDGKKGVRVGDGKRQRIAGNWCWNSHIYELDDSDTVVVWAPWPTCGLYTEPGLSRPEVKS